jgi:hypothetical protein
VPRFRGNARLRDTAVQQVVPNEVLLASAAVSVLANAIPAMLPAVRAVVRHPDGTITAPLPRAKMVMAAEPDPASGPT